MREVRKCEGPGAPDGHVKSEDGEDRLRKKTEQKVNRQRVD
jgi:hypothetical protein